MVDLRFELSWNTLFILVEMALQWNIYPFSICNGLWMVFQIPYGHYDGCFNALHLNYPMFLLFLNMYQRGLIVATSSTCTGLVWLSLFYQAQWLKHYHASSIHRVSLQLNLNVYQAVLEICYKLSRKNIYEIFPLWSKKNLVLLLKKESQN